MTGNAAGSVVGRAAWPGDSPTTALLDDVLERIAPHLAGIVDDFYLHLTERRDWLEVVLRLSDVELTRLKRQQVHHLRALMSPTVSDRQLHERSREIGRIHAMVGVEMDWYVDAVAQHRRGLVDAMARHAADLDVAPAQTLLGERFMGDLHGALLGYRDLDRAQSRVMLRLTESVSQARTVADLARGLVESLSVLDGMAVCFFARPDAEGYIQYEIGAGTGFDEFFAEVTRNGRPPINTGNGSPGGHGPMGRAWRTGETQRCDSYEKDPALAQWRSLAAAFGWRSGASVPLVNRRGATRAILSLQAYWPGYFASDGSITMLEQIKQTFERALAELEQQPSLASGVSGYVDRTSHLARLARGEVQMLFQPVVSLPDGGLVKLEALARLRGESRLVSPAEFLPAFGDDELFSLFEIGLHQSLEALRAWEAEGLHTGVSVNLPVVSADDDRYVRLVTELLQRYDVAPSRLTLELLETGFVDREMHQRRRSFDEFKELGVRLAQDDLGSGYSSLLRLQHFAFDDVKIDQSLVRGTELAPGAALHFIKPINTIAHSLGLSVVIEGLENDGLIEAAVQLGVDKGQGYGIARPMPAADVTAWARGYRLDVDPCTPRTPMGALAAHVAWEHRVTAMGDHSGHRPGLDLDACPLTTFALGRDAQVVAAHEVVHAAGLDDRGGAAHRAGWDRLVALLTSS